MHAPAISLEPGEWDLGEHRPLPPAGFLVLQGCVVREVSVLGGTTVVDLFALGDLVRPDEEQPLVSVPSSSSWVVLEPTTVAVLDAEFLNSAQPWPHIVAELLRRQDRRADWLAHILAVSHLPRVELRVLVLFWLFADRWGRRRGDGTVVRVPLTHRNIARLVGAHRPTVTAAVQRLVEAEKIVPDGRGCWLLRGEPPSTADSSPQL